MAWEKISFFDANVAPVLISRFLRILGCAGALALVACGGHKASATCPDQALESSAEDGEGEQGEVIDEGWVRAHYDKREVSIPMRDGVKLFTAIYVPKEGGRHPIMMKRTPYSVGPYGATEFPSSLGPSEEMMRDGYIFIYQDVRGRFMSEGEFVNMTPHRPQKTGPKDIDESTDTYDTVSWLLEEIEGHNGRVGQWGISYPGFYAAAGMIDAHPALKAVSPQAPIADWFFDDFHHHGAFFLPHLFNFIASFGRPREGLTTKWPERFAHGTPDGYQFFLEMGPLHNANDRYFHHEIPFWDAVTTHPNYDSFWQARNILPHLKNVAPAVMTVGGWFDAEDLYGPLQIYRAIEKNDPDAFNILVMGPWAHGGWSRTDGDLLGDIAFGEKHSLFYREEIERRFFAHFLKDEGEMSLPEAYVFETGANRWRSFEQWPPQTRSETLYFGEGGRLHTKAPTGAGGFDAFISDPQHPVPFSSDIDKGMTKAYMTDDQRFAARRPDVLVYQSEVLEEAVTLAGPLVADLWVSTDRADADWVVKLIDVFPGGAKDHDALSDGMHMGGYQMMVRSEVLRGRFRDSYEVPKPFQSGKVTEVQVPLQDVLHTFQKGHRIMVQVQSTWFPIVDRNPQSWVENIFEAKADDFVKAEHRVYHDAQHASSLSIGRLEP